MEHVRVKIRCTLPSLKEEQLESVITKLMDLGVTHVDDCKYLTAADLDGILPPIQSRRLISAFCSASQSTVVESCAPSSSRSDHVTPAVSPTVTSQSFQVPWHKFPVKLMNTLKEKGRPLPKDRRHMVRIIIEDLMASDTRPGRSKLKQIAQQLVEKHPDSFLDKFGTNVVGQGFGSLVMQMENRIENVRRQFALSTSPSERPKKKSRLSDRYGCSQWEPESQNDCCNNEEKKKMLQEAFKGKPIPESNIKTLMSDTYYAQRITLNNEDNVIKVMEQWPYLFEANHLLDHTEKLVGFSVQTKLMNQIEEKGKPITEFLKSKGITVTTDPIKLLQGLMEYLTENPKVLLLNKDEALSELPTSPCILVVDEGRYQISVDEVTVNKNIGCPLIAVSYMFSLYYVLNIMYPKGAALTLEFIQRSLLGINPERGSKAEKKGTKQYNIPPKLLRFLSDLNDFQNPWKI